MPFVVAINFYRNWLSVPSVKKLPIRAGDGSVRNVSAVSGPTGMDTIAVQLRLLAIALKQVFLRLYCPMRRRREAGAEGSWLLLALLPPVGAFLLALVLSLFAKVAAIAAIVVGVLYALFAVYVSFMGPTAQNAEATLTAVRASSPLKKAQRWHMLASKSSGKTQLALLAKTTFSTGC